MENGGHIGNPDEYDREILVCLGKEYGDFVFKGNILGWSVVLIHCAIPVFDGVVSRTRLPLCGCTVGVAGHIREIQKGRLKNRLRFQTTFGVDDGETAFCGTLFTPKKARTNLQQKTPQPPVLSPVGESQREGNKPQGLSLGWRFLE